MWLLVDDCRNLSCDVIARTYEAGKVLLASVNWNGLCIDHDLGEKQTGYDLINWALENYRLPSKVQIVSANPVGRENIERTLKNRGYTLEGATWVQRVYP